MLWMATTEGSARGARMAQLQTPDEVAAAILVWLLGDTRIP